MPFRRPAAKLAAARELGVPDGEGRVVLVVPDADVPLGGKLF